MTDDHTFDDFTHALTQSTNLATWEQFALAHKMAEFSLCPSIDSLIAPSLLSHLTILPHQLTTVKKVVQDMNGRALLADEVGLGKTIEAGLILKEYLIRGLVKKVLILCPASLNHQWAEELYNKFHIRTTIAKKNPNWKQSKIMISSIDLAKRSQHQDIILSLPYDLVIIDEAHKLKNNRTKNYQFVKQINKKYCLLLTATPVHNSSHDLYHLSQLIKPGLITKKDVDHLANDANHIELRPKLDQVMTRFMRKETSIQWNQRFSYLIPIELNEDESTFYQDLLRYLRTHSVSFYHLYLREWCSSHQALYLSIKKNQLPDHQLILNRLNTLNEHPKALKLIELVKNINHKCVVFTEFRGTQAYLQWLLHQHGISSVLYSGHFKKGKREWVQQLFKDKIQVMIATEAAGEGINLQFCHHLINYDLPWNPMRVEQRIGRIHRLGQQQDVHIYNFSIKHTIEDTIMDQLYKKLAICKWVVGDLDEILPQIH